MSVELARLALTDDAARRPLFWRGEATVADGGLRLAPGATLDLGTWFNAAPVAWWRDVLGPGHVRLVVQGSGRLRLWTTAHGQARVEQTVDLDGTWEARIPRTDDAGWAWLDVTDDGSGTAHVRSVSWTAQRPPAAVVTEADARAQRVTVVVPTYGREDDALEQVERLLAPGLDGVVGRVVLVDQARTVRGAPRFDQVRDASGDRLVLVEQDNLGGSGGYTRGMLESLAFPGDAVLLLDDDAQIEPETLRRLLVLAGCAAVPTIMGTALLSAEAPTQVEAVAEGVRPRGFVWGPSDGLRSAVDLAGSTPDAWTFADPAARTDYTGWWGTLLPAGAVERLGLSVPYFLKWDDAEYGLRARREGFAVRTLPGTGTWHPTWAAKGTISSWSAWPLHRNRLATAAAYGADRSVLRDSLVHQVKHVLSLQYDTADQWDAALAQLLDGPGWLTSDLRTVRGRAQALLDAAPHGPDVDGSSARDVTAEAPRPAVAAALRAVVGLVTRPSGRDAVRVEPARFTWRTGLGRDVVELGGRTVVRDPERARAALARTVRLHARAARAWRALQREYGTALPASRATQVWQGTIQGDD